MTQCKKRKPTPGFCKPKTVSPSFPTTYSSSYTSPTFHGFFRDAHAALAAFRPRRHGCRSRRRRGRGLKRLTLFLEEGTYHLSRGYSDPEPEKDTRVADLFDDPAVARLEELIIICADNYHNWYSPPLNSLPCIATSRVLELKGCRLEQPSPIGLSFPHLTDLTLRRCYFLEGYLQEMIDAAPALAVIALENVTRRAPEPAGSNKKDFNNSDYIKLPLCFRCPTVTAVSLVIPATYYNKKELEACINDDTSIGIELDMPSLRFFRYHGFPIKISLASRTPGLARVDLDVTPRHEQHYGLKYEPPSRMLASFSSARALKLRLSLIEDLVADDDDDDEAEHNVRHMLPKFPNLKLLEIDGDYQYMNSKTAVVTAMLLRSCPAMSELRLRLDMRWDYHHNQKYEDHVGGSFGEAMDRFESLASMSSAHRDAVQISGISELPDALTNNDCAFLCLQKSLRKVTLQFKAKEMNCFQVQLAKFLVENAMVLEEMHVDDGSRFWPDHLFHKVARWQADAFQRRNLPGTAGFRVYQLANRAVGSENS
uniref:Uncharacterized protein n=1 Tax=Avena sativa TaxID=4498 RepID=A0ACD5YAR9_AVESA